MIQRIFRDEIHMNCFKVERLSSNGEKMSKNGFAKSINEAELAEGHMKAVRVNGKPILLVRVGGRIYAVSNLCPHAGCQLQSGILTDYIVMCPCHGWKFDIRTGEYQENSIMKLTSYLCKVDYGKLYIQITTDKR
jgi:nitrite reductase/ring-hydroxylating ferredoxin subunit